MMYHYTCDHGWAAIQADGWMIRPNNNPVLGFDLAWFTDLPVPDRHALGLTSLSLSCDRTQYRVEVPDVWAMDPWWVWCRRRRIPWEVRGLLEGSPRAQPLRWWVSEVPVAGKG